MDDLKIIFYIIVAIVWMVYNNYRKISEESKKRDPSRPAGDEIEESGPYEPPVNRKPSIPTVFRRKEQPSPAPVRSKPTAMKRTPLRKERMSSSYNSSMFISPSREGGNVQPSKLVQFEEVPAPVEQVNPWTETIRNADFRTGIVLAEILKRPYN
jgi:hypothetical protein